MHGKAHLGDVHLVSIAVDETGARVGFVMSVERDGFAADGATATVTRTYVDTHEPDGVSIGDKVRISVAFKSTDLHFPFVPFVHDGLVTSTAESRVDWVPDPDNPPQDCS